MNQKQPESSDYYKPAGKHKSFTKKWIIALLATASVFGMTLFIPYFHVAGIIAIELADEISFHKITESLPVSLLRHSLTLDYVFIICYTALFYYSVKIASQIKVFSKWKWPFLLIILPGLLDVAENIMMAILTDAQWGFRSLFIWYWCTVRVKWTLAAVDAIVVLLAIARIIGLYSKAGNRFKNKNTVRRY